MVWLASESEPLREEDLTLGHVNGFVESTEATYEQHLSRHAPNPGEFRKLRRDRVNRIQASLEEAGLELTAESKLPPGARKHFQEMLDAWEKPEREYRKRQGGHPTEHGE